jgi:serine/threonine protein kinase/tetratricopeptide (TPR) repeat protein
MTSAVLPSDDAAHPRAESLFYQALELPGAGRSEFLEQSCAGDASLWAEVEKLLHDYEAADGFMTAGIPVAAYSAPAGSALQSEAAGDGIGPYKLMEQLGEGGFGTVWVAEQEKPVRRRVALKIIKPGMDTKQVVARFEQERQALAMMDHPHIARVFDAGATPLGRPYFVMELVRGVKITTYCDQNQLPTAERLRLFIAVCHAVQHAHQKGIIHRDLKPSNILVTLHDGVPVPKVIDFGIAKAMREQRLTDLTVYTQFEQFVGTPAYMSPEQAELSGLDIDTRSDIYALGVLLYELLTGTTPFDAKELLNAGFEEMRRIIREDQPAKPSTRLTQSRNTSTKEQPAKSSLLTLRSSLSSDLDWIVMKSLEKDRSRRYETAHGLARDIQRHLTGEPVIARPPSRLYRFQKMVRRNRLAVGAGVSVFAALVAGAAVSTWQAIRATKAEHEQSRLRSEAQQSAEAAKTEAAKSKQTAQFLKDMLKGVGPSRALGDDTKMLRKILDQTAERIGADLKDQPEVEAELRNVIGNVYEGLGEYEKAWEMLEEALANTKKLRGDEHPDVAALLNDLALVLDQQGEMEKAEAMLRQSLAMKRKLLGNDADVSVQLNNLATTLTNRGRLEEAESVHREALAITRKLVGKEHDDVASSLSNLGPVLEGLGKYSEAEAVLREALEMQRKLHGADDPGVATTINNLANVLRKQNKLSESEIAFREALTLQRKLLGNAHPNVAAGLNGLGLALLVQGRADEAEPLLREGMEIERKARKNAHPQTATLVGNLGRVMEGLRKYEKAESLYREAISILRELPETEHPDEVNWRNRLHNCLQNQGKLAEMETFHREIIAIQKKRYGDEHPEVAEALTNFGNVLVYQKRIPESEPPYREALAIRRKLSGDDVSLVKAIYNLAMTLNWLGKSAEVEPLSQEVADLTVSLMDSDTVETKSKRDALTRIMNLYQVIGKPDKAADWRLKLAGFDNSEAPAANRAKAVLPELENQRKTQ